MTKMFGLLMSGPAFFALSACGGGSSGGVASTPAPTPSPSPTPTPAPTPTPTPTPTAGVSGNYAAKAVTARFTVGPGNNDLLVNNATQRDTNLTVNYDASSNTYTLTSAAETASFGPASLDSTSTAQSQSWTKGGGQYLLISHANYVSGGFWQRQKQNGSLADVDLDAFVYGTKTAQSSLPTTGAVRFNVALSGVSGVLGNAIYPISGTGFFEIDFGTGSFRTTGQTRSFNLTVDYWTGSQWSGTGTLTSGSNQFNGSITLDARYHTVAGILSGSFYGPNAAELGATIRASDQSDAAFVGALIGVQGGTVDSAPFTVLPNGADRTYGGVEELFALDTVDGGHTWGSPMLIPLNSFMRITFGADNSIKIIPNPGGSTDTSLTFRDTNKIAAESTAAYSIYSLNQGSDHYRFTIANPGPGNSEIQLTYSGFGHLDLDRSTASTTAINQLWFAYGVLAQAALGRTGTGQYNGLLHGSGGDYRDGSRYAVDGTASFAVNFDTHLVSGALRPVATLVSGATAITLPELRFTSDLSGGAFGDITSTRPDVASGGLNVAGRLYGPTGEELAGTFQYAQRDGGGHPVNWFSGAFATKVAP